MRARLPLTLAASVAGLLALTGCVANGTGTGTDGTHKALTVDSSADACTVSSNKAPAGKVRFTVTNSGDQVTEFYLLGDDGLRIVGGRRTSGRASAVTSSCSSPPATTSPPASRA